MGFINSNKEYVIENMYPEKRPLMNFLWNEEYVAVIDQFGFGKGRYSSANNFEHEIVKNGPSRILYIKENGKAFSPNRNFEREPFDVFETTVGQGYSTIISEYRGFRTEYTILVPSEGKCECWRTKIKNTSNETKSFDFYTYVDIWIMFSWHLSCTYGDFDKDLNGVYFKHIINDMKTTYTTGYIATNAEMYSYGTAKRRFIGYYGNVDRPDGVVRMDRLPSQSNSFDNETCGVIHSKITLAPGEEKVIFSVVGVAETVKGAAEDSKKRLNADAFDREMELLKQTSDKYDNCVAIKTPDDDIIRFVNIWLKRQLELGKTWGRVYNKGFRDIMQDIAGFLSLDHHVSREKILDCTQYQFEDGNTIRSWVPEDRWPYRDGAVWLLQTVASYIKESGDVGILEEMIPYMDTDGKTGSLYEHCIKGADFLLHGVGQHGLCLWGGGDWNDSFDSAGLQLKGESVWLSIATVKGVNDLIDVLNFIGKTEEAEHYTKERDIMTANIQKYGYDVDHYIYGYTDWDEKIGSYETEEGRVFLNPQTWSVIAGVAEDNDAVLDVVERELSCDYGYVQQAPCYSKPNPHVGRIAYFGKGFYENGSVYNHGVAFKIVADCLAGRGEYAYQTMKKMLPTNPKNSSEMSGMEPYAISNMYFGPENDTRAGEAPMFWITGTSSWLFRGIVEYIIGVRAEFDGLLIEPQFPECWDHVEVKRTFRGAVYNIKIDRTGEKSIVADGVSYADKLPAFQDGKEHEVYVTI